MPTRRRRNNNNSHPASHLIQINIIKAKFERIKALRQEIAAMRDLYREHDALMEEVMPLFVEKDADKITFHREYTIGRKTYRYNPSFYDQEKDIIKAKVWKSTAFQSGTIE